jgi:hypothetical protein
VKFWHVGYKMRSFSDLNEMSSSPLGVLSEWCNNSILTKLLRCPFPVVSIATNFTSAVVAFILDELSE